VRFYNGTTLTSTITITAPSSSTPTTITEGTLTSSWNYLIPASLMQPNLRILADVDPTNAVSESSESDNSFPTSGNAATMDVRTVSTFFSRLVPVIQSVNGFRGGVTTGNASQYIAATAKLYPLGTVDVDVRAPFTTNAPVLQPNDGNGAWARILSELSALRTADGNTRHYYGVVRVNYNSGIAGLATVGGRSALGWDFLPYAGDVMAHEVGHNFGRIHAPNCGATATDPAYPHPGGTIGVYGYDLAATALKPTSTFDVMGNCDNAWISDYTYNGVLAYRSANPFTASVVAGAGGARRGLLVWGRVENGQLILEPTFEVNAPISLPAKPGKHRLEAFGPLGQRLFSLSFDGERTADVPDATAEHFAFVVPMDGISAGALDRIRWSTGGRQVELRASAQRATPADDPKVERVDANRVRVTWSGAQTRGVVIRDARTGDILSFGRDGESTVYSSEASFDLDVSDGVRSVRRRVGVTPQGR
jgi:hypothetical protein